MAKLLVAVLRGGPSSEYDVSMQTGQNILNNLSRDKYESRDILIAKDGVWHAEGKSRKPEQILRHVDVVINAMHGEYGEDGKVQKILEHLNVPYTGSGVFASMLAMNKAMAKEHVKKEGIKTPIHIVFKPEEHEPLEDAVIRAFRTMPLPLVIKPLAKGSSVGVSIATDFESFRRGMRMALSYSDRVLIEEFIKGREATCGVIDNFRGESIYSLLPIEIRVPSQKEFFDYEAKYSGISEEICPGNFSTEETKQIQELAVAAHRVLGLRHYSRSDFIVHPKRGIYFLESNTLPGFTNESLFPKSLRAVGSDVPEFIDHLITLALKR